jgi:hypothetical protein
MILAEADKLIGAVQNYSQWKDSSSMIQPAGLRAFGS